MDDYPLSILTPPPSPEPAPPRLRSRRIFGQLVFLMLVLFAAGAGALAGLVFVYSSNLPQVRQLEVYRPDVMTELYADDGAVIGSFALERRVIVNYDQIPRVLKDAVLSVEDRHFESHWGVDVIRIVRAGITDILEWRWAQGASTLTQQLSRMLFLSPQKTPRRKFQEVLLAIQIERHFTKPQIFTMYSNQVNLGHGNYGFQAAAQFYFGKPLNQLTLPEAALLAGLVQSPGAYSPIQYSERAVARRNRVLAAMLDNQKISEEQYRRAKSAPLVLNIQRWDNNAAPYFVEEVRQFLERKYGTEAVHEKGLRVYTTLNARLQRIAEQALRRGLHEYDKRHAWRGPVKNILKNPPGQRDGRPVTLATHTESDWKRPLQAGALIHGLVMDVKPDHALVRFGELTARVTPRDFAWTRKSHGSEVLDPGDVHLFLIKEIKGQTLQVALDQRPAVQGALVVIENSTGAVKAMVGGYDFEESKFNRARQATRQAGSSFKVYVYAAALLEGADPFDKILDAPVSFPFPGGVWTPGNYDGNFQGEISLLRALAESRNIPAVRLLTRVGVDKVIKLCRKFGISSRLVPNFPLALGASDLTLLEQTSAFTALPNDGVRISPRMIQRVTNYQGRVIDEFSPEVTDVLPAPIARLEVSMLREVINSGTASKVKALKRSFAGKTGTTNDYSDAWFIGFSPSLTCGVWVGFDDRRTLGSKEEGARAALPIWMEFMDEALKDQPVEEFPHSPLLTTPDQVKQILDSAGAERLLATRSAATSGGGNSPAAPAHQEGGPVLPASNAGVPGGRGDSASSAAPSHAAAESPAHPAATTPAGSSVPAATKSGATSGRIKPPASPPPAAPR